MEVSAKRIKSHTSPSKSSPQILTTYVSVEKEMNEILNMIVKLIKDDPDILETTKNILEYLFSDTFDASGGNKKRNWTKKHKTIKRHRRTHVQRRQRQSGGTLSSSKQLQLLILIAAIFISCFTVETSKFIFNKMIEYPVSFFNNILIPIIIDYSNKIIPCNILSSLAVNTTDVDIHTGPISTPHYPQPTCTSSMYPPDTRPLFQLLTLFFTRIALALSVGDLLVLNALKALVGNIYSLKEYFFPKKSRSGNDDMKKIKVKIIHQTNILVNGIYNATSNIMTPNTFIIPDGSKLLLPFGKNLINPLS